MDKSIELIKEVGSLANKIESHNQTMYDFFIKMVQDGNLTEEDFYKLALIANKEKICREVKNCLTIEKKKREIIFNNKFKLPKMKNTNSYADDWRAYFDRLCSTVSDEAMQDIWAKILVKETIQPGSVSRAMLNTFSLLDSVSAKCFEKICSLTFEINQEGENRKIPLILYDDIICEMISDLSDDLSDELKEKFYAYEEYIPGQREIEYLSELNLLKISEDYMEYDIYSIEEMKLNFMVGDKKFDTVSPYDAEENRYYVCVGQVFFTQTGLALYNAISRNIEKYQYLYDVLKTYIEYRSK